jgi:predicted HicB family RNase H-like nuclease
LESEESLYRIEKGLSETIRLAAKERGVSPHTLVNLWLQEKVQKLKTGTDHR